MTSWSEKEGGGARTRGKKRSVREREEWEEGGSSLFNAEWLDLQLHADCIASTAENT